MRLRSLSLAVIAAVIVLPGQAAEPTFSQTSAFIASALPIVPFALSYQSVQNAQSKPKIGANKHWKVDTVRAEGDKTALELHSVDQQMKINMTIDTRIVQSQQIKTGDAIDIDAIGKTGYVVKKGPAPVALLAEPGTGMTHSAPRS